MFSVDMGFLLAMLPPGAFISLRAAARRAQLARPQRRIMNKKKVAAIFARLKALESRIRPPSSSTARRSSCWSR